MTSKMNIISKMLMMQLWNMQIMKIYIFLGRKERLEENLEIFRNVDIDYNKIIRNYTSEEGIWNYMDSIHKVKDKVFNKLFNYFISGFLKSLNLSNTALKNNQFLYKGAKYGL